MSMIGNYLRIRPSQLTKLLSNPDTLMDTLYPEETDHPDEMFLDIDKTWHAIHYLLNGHTWEGYYPLINAVLAGTKISDEDLGYGPARYLSPEEVTELSNALHSVPPEELMKKYKAIELNTAEIYFESWQDNENDREYVRSHYSYLRDFLAAAAKERDAIIMWLS